MKRRFASSTATTTSRKPNQTPVSGKSALKIDSLALNTTFSIAEEHTGIDTLVSNVAFALRVSGIEQYDRRGLEQSIDYSAWPLVAYLKAIHKRFGRYPSYAIGLSSDGPDGFFQNYDFVAMSKAVLETMARYLNFRLFEEQVRVNVIRSRLVRTASFDATFGAEFHDFLEALGGFEDCYTTPEDIANAALALGSGLLDAVGGQVIMVDKGFEFFDNLMGIGERARKRGVRFGPPLQPE